MNLPHLIKQLQTGIKALKISVDPAVEEKLIRYIELLNKWNAIYNLTAIRSLKEMVTRHLLDSLVVCRFFPKALPLRVIDVGTGPGLPGIVLALCNPTAHFVLLDSQQKK